MRYQSLVACTIVLLLAGSAGGEDGSGVSFARQIAPLLAAKCYACHGPDEEARQADLRLDKPSSSLTASGRDAAIVPGNASQSELLRRVTASSQQRMPPPDHGPALNAMEIDLLRRWIDSGAQWEVHWAFAPAEQALGLPIVGSLPMSNRIDALVNWRLMEADLLPAPQASKRTLVRRAYLDLTGLPPSQYQIDRFLADDRPIAYEILVDSLLCSPQYAPKWARHWLDVARYGDSNGGDENHAYPLAHRYRDYVIRARNDDMPFDLFIRQQLAGDLLPRDVDQQQLIDQITATGYLAIGMKILAEKDLVKRQADLVDEQIDTLGRTFLGMSLGCARCHDHKFDPIATKDYYALAGVFQSTFVLDAAIESKDFLVQKATFQQRSAELKRQINELDEKLHSPGDLQRAITLQAESFQRGNVIVDTGNYGKGIGIISDPGRQANFAEYDLELEQGAYILQLRYAAATPRPGVLKINGRVVDQSILTEATGGWMPEHQKWITEGPFAFRAGENSVRIESEPMMSHIDQLRLLPADEIDVSSLRLRSKLEKQLSELAAPAPIKVMSVVDKDVHNERVHRRGSHLDLGDEVQRGFIGALDGDRGQIPADQSGRLQLADWLTGNSTARQLVARVIANRLWHWHFGRGLVETPDDFGTRGQTPTHPALLDYLAGYLIEHKWSLKALQREIVTSDVYRRCSIYEDPKAAKIDPGNRLLWRRDLRRLDAELIRDSLLQAAGRLDLASGDSPMKVKSQDPSPMDMQANLRFYDSFSRRSIYLPIVRSNVYEYLTLFDFPNASTPVGNRDQTTTPTQALWLLNSAFVVEMARELSGKYFRRNALSESITRVYVSLLCRPPTEQELAAGLSFLKQLSETPTTEDLAALCQVLIASGEFLYMR